MPEAQDRMFPKHPRPRIAHDHLYLFAAILLITMHRALCAGRFVRAETASVQPHAGVIEQPLALGTQSTVVMIAAVNADHHLDGPPFARETFACFAR